MSEKTKIWLALTKEGFGIVSVIADSEEEAKKRIKEQLDRPGRRHYYNQWVDGGEKVKVKG